jgi:cell division protein FtsZ
MNSEIVEFDLPRDKSVNIIKVVGVGGGGSNAVSNMYRQGIHNVSFAVCNTDSQDLAKSEIPVRVELGERGLGVGGNPAKGKEAAEEDLDKIRQLFADETQMVFITAGMGGGTGTGAAPVIAGVAKEMGLLTVGVVTIPFAFEGKRKIRKALAGVEEMRKNVDALLIINNERLIDMFSDGDAFVPIPVGFEKTDEVLTDATKSIAEIITIKGIINRDFCDVETVMKDGGNAIMGMGTASGEHRIEKAIYKALSSPLLNDFQIEQAERLLYIVYSCDENPVGMHELQELTDFMETLPEDIEILWGVYRDDTLGDAVRVDVIATGFNDEQNAKPTMQSTEAAESERLTSLMEKYYGEGRRTVTEKPFERSQPASTNAVVDNGALDEGDEEDIVSSDTPSLISRLKKKLDDFVNEMNTEG